MARSWQTEIISLVPCIVSSPIVMMRLLTVPADGIWSPGRKWVYSRRRRNWGFSVASKGWSAATIHSLRYWSNCFWSNALPYAKEKKRISTQKGWVYVSHMPLSPPLGDGKDLQLLWMLFQVGPSKRQLWPGPIPYALTQLQFRLV